ncbi:MAG TPA: tRNA (guanosine(37)-N1)-methyltransferase TrmD [Firmicutes bacterium]|nr:tRNA (guanosine(37)-N1)-methyltransferase TrmD [Bacillota bacterium]
MLIDVLTLFPGMFSGPLEDSILKRARESGLLRVRLFDIREFAFDKHRVTDDTPYGGGQGMVMKPEPIFRAVEAAGVGEPPPRVVLMCPQGEVFTQRKAWELADHKHLILICGRYEGVDERVRTNLADDVISIGDYVLTGGEIPALVVIDSVVRLIPGVLGDPASPYRDSFMEGLLEGPQYTRPQAYRGLSVPQILLTGDHERIWRWRRRMALLRTRQVRPDLFAQAKLTSEDYQLLQESSDE